MWSEQRDKKTRFFERYKDPMTGKTKIASITLEGKDTAKNRKIAQEVLGEKIKEALAAGPVKGKDLTLEKVVEVYRKYQNVTLSRRCAGSPLLSPPWGGRCPWPAFRYSGGRPARSS